MPIEESTYQTILTESFPAAQAWIWLGPTEGLSFINRSSLPAGVVAAITAAFDANTEEEAVSILSGSGDPLVALCSRAFSMVLASKQAMNT